MNSFSTYFKNKDDRNDFYIAIGVIILFLGCGIFYSLNLFDSQELVADALKDDTSAQAYIADERSGFQFENEEDKAFTTVLLKDKRNVEKVDHWLDKSQDTLALLEEEDTDDLLIQNMIDSIEASKIAKEIIVDTEIETQEDTISNIKEIPEDTDITEDTETSKEENNIESLNNTTITSTTKEKTSTKEEVKQPKRSDTKPNSKNSAVSSTSSNCVIVVGAFSLAENADELKKKLIKKGYPAYTFFRKGNKVVGIKQSCDNTKATQKMLKEIQSKYNSAAWILKNK